MIAALLFFGKIVILWEVIISGPQVPALNLMLSMKSRLILCVFVLLLAGPLYAANYGDITVQYISLCSPLTGTQPTTHGMIEHRFRVQNRSASTTRTVAIQLKADSHADYGLRSATGAVEVPAGQTAQIVILQPPVPMNPITAVVRINGYTQNATIRVDVPTSHCDPYTSFRHYSYSPGIGSGASGPSNAHILVSGKTSTPFRDLFSQGVKPKIPEPDPSAPPPVPVFDPATGMGMGGMPGGMMGGGMMGVPPLPREITLWRSEGDLDQWSDNWLALTRFDAILVTVEELATIPMTQPIGKALRRYIECGGTLCVVGTEWTAPKEWKEVLSTDDFTQWDALLGSAFLLKKPVESSDDAVTTIRNKILERSDAWTTAMRSDAYYGRGMYGYSGGGTGFFSDPRTMAIAMPTSESQGVPVRAISILIIVFAVLIGPVNVYVLSWKKRRIWLLWTVPAISLVASGLVLGTNFSQEGFVRYTSVSSVTILDQRREEAISFGILGFYSTLTPRGGCVFENGTEPTIIANRSRHKYDLVSYPGGSQNLTSGWIQPRVPAYFGIRKAATELKGLEFNWDVESPTVVNQLGVDIEQLTVCSPDGTFYETKKILAGEKTVLTKFAVAPTNAAGQTPLPVYEMPPLNPMNSSAAAPNNQLSQMFWRLNNWQSIAATLTQEPTRYLENGSYIVSLGEESNPFIEPGIADAKPFQNKSVIVGFY